jgi:hypothetical protein
MLVHLCGQSVIYNISDTYASHVLIFCRHFKRAVKTEQNLLPRFSVTYSSATPKRRYFIFATLKRRVFFATPKRREDFCNT